MGAVGSAFSVNLEIRSENLRAFDDDVVVVVVVGVLRAVSVDPALDLAAAASSAST